MSLPNTGLGLVTPRAPPLLAPQAVLPVVEAVVEAVVEVVLLVEAVLWVVEVALLVEVVVDPSASAWGPQPQLEGMEVSKATCPPSSKATEPRAINS
jgi:hypothetical protein